MAWRPAQCLIRGELNNTRPGKVTGWLDFAGMNERVVLELDGDFHRDIRGTRIQLKGPGIQGAVARAYMNGFEKYQHGLVGDMTAGLEPRDYVDYPYFEWYAENDRVVLELVADQVRVIGRPIPAIESEPSRRTDHKVLEHLRRVVMPKDVQVLSIAISTIPERFSHWVIVQGYIVGEARDIRDAGNGMCFAYVRLFGMPELAEYGSIPKSCLVTKNPT